MFQIKSTNGKEANLPLGAGGLREGSKTNVAIIPKVLCKRGSPSYGILPKKWSPSDKNSIPSLPSVENELVSDQKKSPDAGAALAGGSG